MKPRTYKAGQPRGQGMLLPPCIDDYVAEGNPVRAIDAYVESLDLAGLGFRNTAPGSGAGQPPFPPAVLLKLYLYGYLNRVHSSRRLEREASRNLEAIWLAQGLRPGYKTIANFRKDNPQALKAANKDFILVCKDLSLFGGEEVAVDGSFFKADAGTDGIYTAKKLDDQLASLEKKIDTYQNQLAEQDARDDRAGLGSLAEDGELAAKLARLKERQAEKQALRTRLEQSADGQLSTVDPDARLLSKKGKTVAGYNVQIAVDAKHKLIVASEATQDGNDRQQLVPMLEKAQEVLQSEHLVGLADTGYHSGEQIQQAEEKGFEVYVPEPKTTTAAEKDGRFTRGQFQYDEAAGRYTCPNGEALEACGKPQERGGKLVQAYKSKVTACAACPLRARCLAENARYKKLERWNHEAAVERHRLRMAKAGGRMEKRSQLAEHPFGTLKHRAGMHHFLMRGLEKCRGELGLMVLCYNLTRVINILGFEALREYCARRGGNPAQLVQYA
jgi:transposase